MTRSSSILSLSGQRLLSRISFVLLFPFCDPAARADLRTDLTGYYSFESEAAGTVPNGARALSLPGFSSASYCLQTTCPHSFT